MSEVHLAMSIWRGALCGVGVPGLLWRVHLFSIRVCTIIISTGGGGGGGGNSGAVTLI